MEQPRPRRNARLDPGRLRDTRVPPASVPPAVLTHFDDIAEILKSNATLKLAALPNTGNNQTVGYSSFLV